MLNLQVFLTAQWLSLRVRLDKPGTKMSQAFWETAMAIFIDQMIHLLRKHEVTIEVEDVYQEVSEPVSRNPSKQENGHLPC